MSNPLRDIFKGMASSAKVGLMQKYSLDVQWRKQPIQLVTLTIKSKRRIPENTNSLNRAISIFSFFKMLPELWPCGIRFSFLAEDN